MGYIGSHIALELLRHGHYPVIVDNLTTSEISTLDALRLVSGENIPFYEVDIANSAELKKILILEKIDFVIHAAASKNPKESISNSLSYYDNNVAKFIALLSVMNEVNVKRIIFSSSAAIYASTPEPITEEGRLAPINPYASTKVMCEKIIGDLAAEDSGWRIGIARYFNPAGADESGQIGELVDGELPNIFPRICECASRNNKFIIYGGDYETKDGTALRDYVHISDLALGHIRLMELLASNSSDKNELIINFGSGHGYTVLEVLHEFSHALGKKIEYEVAGRRDGDIAISCASINKAKTELNWFPKRNLRDMCRDSLKQYAMRNNEE